MIELDKATQPTLIGKVNQPKKKPILNSSEVLTWHLNIWIFLEAER